MANIDISRIIESAGVALERQATGEFGAAVEDFVRGGLGITKPGIGQQLPPSLQPKSSVWDATSYAAVLAGATEYRPKLKFLFKVQFFFTAEVIALYPDLARNEYSFMIKQVDRPKIDFEYTDDLNLYNFRTKALKRIKHRELTVTFMDDVGNNVFDFFRSLMMIYSPITRDSVRRDNQFNELPQFRKFETGNGMQFSPPDSFATADVANRAVIDNYAGNAISLIRVKQLFLDPTKTGSDKQNAVSSNYYDFINPRLVSFDLDDLNHESSEVNLLTMQFDYDWLEMTKNSGLQSLTDGAGPVFPVTVPSRTGSETSGIPTDILFGQNTGFTGNSVNERGASNPFANILSNAAGQVTQRLTGDLVDRVVKGVSGAVGNSTLGRVVVGGLTDGLGAITNQVGGLVSTGVRDQANGLIGSLTTGVSTISSSTARLGRSLFSDSGTVGPDSPQSRLASQTIIPGRPRGGA